MANKSQYLQEGVALDHTPVGAITAGKIIQIGSVAAFSPRPVGASELSALAVSGVIRGPHAATVGNVGDNVWWDANGTPYGGSADGAFTTEAEDGDFWVGTLVAATGATDSTCDIALNVENPNLPAWPNRGHIRATDDLSWAAATHSGLVVHLAVDGKTVTLPAGVAGMEAIIVNDAADAAAGISVDLDGVETAEGNLAIGAGEVATNTKETAIRGDFLHLVCETDASLWRVSQVRGIWAVA